MNYIPLKDRTSTDHERYLEEALREHLGLTEPIRTAMRSCELGESPSVRCRELVAAAHIVCTPGEVQRNYANSIRGDLPTAIPDREVARDCSQMAVDAMQAILKRLGNLRHEDNLRVQYLEAIRLEKARALVLARKPVAV